MKLQILSDLHIDVRPLSSPVQAHPDADLVLVAGDVQQGLQASLDALDALFPSTPYLTVPGNHSFYKGCITDPYPDHPSLLENSSRIIGGVHFIGTTLWTDYNLYSDFPRATEAARTGLNDHRRIAYAKRPEWRRFVPQHAYNLHLLAKQFLYCELGLHPDLPKVVITHHAPHPNSIHPRYGSDPLNAAYASDLTSLITHSHPALWIHGHVHSSFDYTVGRTRIVCNPHGYGTENPDFDPQLLIEV